MHVLKFYQAMRDIINVLDKPLDIPNHSLNLNLFTLRYTFVYEWSCYKVSQKTYKNT